MNLALEELKFWDIAEYIAKKQQILNSQAKKSLHYRGDANEMKTRGRKYTVPIWFKPFVVTTNRRNTLTRPQQISV